MQVFHVDVNSILKTIYDSLKSYITGNQKLTSENVDSIVKSSVDQHAPEQETKLSSQLRYISLLKLAVNESKFNKNAGPFDLLRARKAPTSLLTTVLSWFFKIALASAGFMVAGDVINKFLGNSNRS